MGDFFIQPVSRKINSIKWLAPTAGQAYTDPNAFFVTGSSDGQQELALWRVDCQDIVDSVDSNKLQAQYLCSSKHHGDVNSIDLEGTYKIETGSQFVEIIVYYIDLQFTKSMEE